MAETQEKHSNDSTSSEKSNPDVKNTQNSSVNTKEILQQAKSTAGQVYDKVAEQASSQIDTQKDNLAQGLSNIADSIRQFGDNVRTSDTQQTPIANLTTRYGDSLADQVEQLSDYLEKKDLRELVKDVEVFARRNPAIFIGGAFALGIVAARFLKSGNSNQSSTRRPRRNKGGVYIPDESEGVYLPEDLSRKVGLSDSPRTSGSTANNSKTANNNSTSDRSSSDAFSASKGG